MIISKKNNGSGTYSTAKNVKSSKKLQPIDKTPGILSTLILS